MVKPKRKSLGKGLGALIRNPNQEEPDRRENLRQYRDYLEMAWEDGRLSDGEARRLEQKREELDISMEKHHKLERIVKRKMGLDVDEEAPETERRPRHPEGEERRPKKGKMRKMKGGKKRVMKGQSPSQEGVVDADEKEVVWDMVDENQPRYDDEEPSEEEAQAILAEHSHGYDAPMSDKATHDGPRPKKGKKKKGKKKKGKRPRPDEEEDPELSMKRERLARINEYFNRGTDLFKAGKYQGAIDNWERILELDPNQKTISKAISHAKTKLAEMEPKEETWDEPSTEEPEVAADAETWVQDEPEQPEQPAEPMSVDNIKADMPMHLLDDEPDTNSPEPEGPEPDGAEHDFESTLVGGTPPEQEEKEEPTFDDEPEEPTFDDGPEEPTFDDEPEEPEVEFDDDAPPEPDLPADDAPEPPGPEMEGTPEETGPAAEQDWHDHQSDIKSELEALKNEAIADMMEEEEKVPEEAPEEPQRKLEGVDFIRTKPGEVMSEPVVDQGASFLKGPAQEKEIPKVVEEEKEEEEEPPKPEEPEEPKADPEKDLKDTLKEKKDLEDKRRKKLEEKEKQRAVKDYFETAMNLGETGRFNEAVIYLEKILDMDPRNVEALNDKGMCLYAVGKPDKAVKAYESALQIEPQYKDALVNLGVAYNHLDLKKEALDAYSRAIKIDPELEEAWYNKGVCFFSAGKFQEAESCFSKAAQLNHNSEEAWSGKAYSLEKLGRFEEAKDTYDLVLGLNPSNEDAIAGKNHCMEEIRKVLMSDYMQ